MSPTRGKTEEPHPQFTIEMRLAVALLLVLFLAQTSPSEGIDSVMRKLAMVGAYAPVTDVRDPQVETAAEFAVSELARSDYSFVSSIDANPGFMVVRAYKQVVAGMNYRLLIMMQDESADSCLGAFGVTVYDQFGFLSISKWSKEISCERALAIVESDTEFHQGYEEDFN